jgi:hypothetical protein
MLIFVQARDPPRRFTPEMLFSPSYFIVFYKAKTVPLRLQSEGTALCKKGDLSHDA